MYDNQEQQQLHEVLRMLLGRALVACNPSQQMEGRGFEATDLLALQACETWLKATEKVGEKITFNREMTAIAAFYPPAPHPSVGMEQIKGVWSVYAMVSEGDYQLCAVSSAFLAEVIVKELGLYDHPANAWLALIVRGMP